MLSHEETLAPLRNHLSFIVVFILSAALSAFAITYFIGEKYEATTTILFKPTEVPQLVAHDTKAFGAPVPQATYKVIGQTLEDLAMSEALLRKIVTRQHLDISLPNNSPEGLYYRWYNTLKDSVIESEATIWSYLKYGRVINRDPTNEAIATLRKNIKIKNSDSYIFLLTVRDSHQDRVADIANDLASELIALLRENTRGPAETRRSQLQDLLDKKHQEIEGYKREIERLLSSNQTASISEEIDKDMYRYSELELSRLNLEAELQQSKAAINAYTAKLDLKGAAIAPSGGEKIQAEDFRKLASDKVLAEINYNGLMAKRASLEDSIQQLSARLRGLPELQTSYELLTAKVQTAEHDYTLLNDALEEAIGQERNNVTEVTVADRASRPNAPTTPIKIYHVGLAAGLGLIVSTGMAIFLGYFNIGIFLPSIGGEDRRRGRRPTAQDANSTLSVGAGAE